MRKSRIFSLSALLAVAAISLPLLEGMSSAVAASPRTALSIGTQLAELVGSDTVAGDWFGSSVAILGTTAVVGPSTMPRLPVESMCSPRRGPAGNRAPSWRAPTPSVSLTKRAFSRLLSAQVMRPRE
jgi:hypothetical protein